MLGLAHQSNRGHLGVKYYGRTVTVTILPVGVDMAQLRSVVAAPEALATLRDLSLAFKDRIVLLGVDDIDLFKGIGLKFLAMERLLEKRPELRGRAVLVQIVNPARSHGRDVEEVADEAVPSPAVHLGAARPPLRRPPRRLRRLRRLPRLPPPRRRVRTRQPLREEGPRHAPRVAAARSSCWPPRSSCSPMSSTASSLPPAPPSTCSRRPSWALFGCSSASSTQTSSTCRCSPCPPGPSRLSIPAKLSTSHFPAPPHVASCKLLRAQGNHPI
ncbi:Alpha,alpha-trehalose-phosphate synthase (UDP-forming) 5 [Ananas comosus]|uniref:Alpha,alpha-trehalose-phosphate synthase (UDP-forming) 5 n=1 Tax=Ananas comosus TaxID=4615 RepID=A0A199W6V8_ANACO|nr:Alpha,alpha-trehalose-phosphate synthase (UDP-forming) 5 [Ananas comosus]